jgi:hypothetical protein
MTTTITTRVPIARGERANENALYLLRWTVMTVAAAVVEATSDRSQAIAHAGKHGSVIAAVQMKTKNTR